MPDFWLISLETLMKYNQNVFFFKGSELDGLHKLQSQPNGHRKLLNACRQTKKITYFAWNLPKH